MLTDRLQKSTPVWKHAVLTAGTTLTIWTPRTGATINLTGLDVAVMGASNGSVHVFFGTTASSVGKSVAMYGIGTTTTISPRFSGLAVGPGVLLQAVSREGNASVTAYGFEE